MAQRERTHRGRRRRSHRDAGPRPTPGPRRSIELTIDALATGGAGVGRDDAGRVTFVPRSAPGDRLQVTLIEEKKKFARGAIETVLQPAEGRVEPECALFTEERCGGCQWQHLDASLQVRAKAAIVARELRQLSVRGVPIMPMIAPVPPYKWRRRARLHYARERGARAAAVGFYAPRGRRIADAERCPQLVPALNDALAILREQLAPHLGSRGHIDVLAGHEGHVHVAITGYCSPRWAAKLVGKSGLHGTIMGVALFPPARDPDRSRPLPSPGAGSRAPMEWGKRSIPLEPSLRGRADLFAQASAEGNAALLDAVDRACGSRAGLRVLELFAGAGNLTRVLERETLELLATDVRPVPWMRQLAVGDALDVIEDLIDDGQYFDLVVLDPPRAGAAELMPALLELHPARVVYVSCDPATLARDLETLQAGGYRAEYAQPLDLMPQTAHIEIVVALSAAEE